MPPESPATSFYREFFPNTRREIFKAGLLVGVILLVFLGELFFGTPCAFPLGKTVSIPEGATLSRTADILESEEAIHSSFLFTAYVRFFLDNHSVLAGDYLLDRRESVFAIAKRITSGDHRLGEKSILFPEGLDIWGIADILQKNFSNFDRESFLKLAAKEEGYLFPDTYYFFSANEPEKIISVMRNNFEKKIESLKGKIEASGYSMHEIITMASIIERETVTPKDRRIVSGILWKRISLKMPLQVDAAFNYVNGKSTFDLTSADLKIDSAYNTYVNRGLPPGPIANPGIDTILSALEPTKTAYLYYLSDKDGIMHYAKTFEEHKVNKFKYLR